MCQKLIDATVGECYCENSDFKAPKLFAGEFLGSRSMNEIIRMFATNKFAEARHATCRNYVRNLHTWTCERHDQVAEKDYKKEQMVSKDYTKEQLMEMPDVCLETEAPANMFTGAGLEMEAPANMFTGAGLEMEAPHSTLSDVCLETEAPTEMFTGTGLETEAPHTTHTEENPHLKEKKHRHSIFEEIEKKFEELILIPLTGDIRVATESEAPAKSFEFHARDKAAKDKASNDHALEHERKHQEIPETLRVDTDYPCNSECPATNSNVCDIRPSEATRESHRHIDLTS